MWEVKVGEEESVIFSKPIRHAIRKKLKLPFRDVRALDSYLQERADLLRQLQKALLALVQGPCDGHVEPLSHCLGAALVEEVGG